jgi:hypothetical protein
MLIPRLLLGVSLAVLHDQECLRIRGGRSGHVITTQVGGERCL